MRLVRFFNESHITLNIDAITCIRFVDNPKAGDFFRLEVDIGTNTYIIGEYYELKDLLLAYERLIKFVAEDRASYCDYDPYEDDDNENLIFEE